MNLHFRAATALALAITSGTASAEQRVGDTYFSPSFGYAWLDNDRNVRDDIQVGVTIGKHFNEWISGEFNATRGTYDFDFSPSDDLGLTSYSLDALHIFARNSRVSPFVSAGVGAMSYEPDGAKDTHHLLGQTGLGLMIDLATRNGGATKFSLRPEVKARWTFPRDNTPQDKYLDVVASLGFQFSFGDPAPIAAPPPPPAAAPPPPPPPPPPPQPVDSDGDGVFDDRDKCPDTPPGVAVDADGCPRRGAATLKGVNFEFNSATLTSESRPVLASVAADLKRYPRLKIELQGHTDNVGADKYNLNLSQKRAQSVREYLLAQGVGEQQLMAKGYGEAEPTADNKTDEGRSQNRRVVMMVLENPGEVKIDVKQP
jgi:OOP family OmpA-OmpF porin